MDPWLLQQKVTMVGVVTAQWIFVSAFPAYVGGYLPTPPGWESLIFVAMAAYCFWTGYRAWKRGWRARFVLRLAVPIGLFAISTCVVGLTKFVLPRA